MTRSPLESVLSAAAAGLLLIAAPFAASAAVPANNKGVVELETDSPAGISVRLAEDMASIVGDGATRRVLPIVGSNALQNITDLMLLRGIDVAILPTDALDYVRQQNLYPNIDGSVTYIAKLYNEEFHLLARSDITSVADLANRKVNIDPANGGTAITASRIFNQLGVQVVPTTDNSAVALEKLRRGEIAALAFVGGKPAPLFQDLSGSDGLHLLSIPMTSGAGYEPAQITRDDYPGLVQSPINTVSVSMGLFVAPLTPNSDRYKNVARFVNTFFTQFQTLLQPGHQPNWNEVDLAATIPGWRRFAPADEWIRRNSAVASNDDMSTDEGGFLALP